MKKYRVLSIILCATAVCALFFYVYAAGIFPNTPYAIGIWCEKTPGAVQYEDYQNMFRIRSYAVNLLNPNYWVVGWRVTTNNYYFWVGASLSVNMEEDAGCQEAWFYICSRYTTDTDPYSYGAGSQTMWIQIDISTYTTYAVIKYTDDYNSEYGVKLWEATDAKYMNGTWEIYFKSWDWSAYQAEIDFYFTPQKVQSQAELVYAWTGVDPCFWLYHWRIWIGYHGYIYVGSSNYGDQSVWRYFSNVMYGTRIL
jgi:hypothetical protein